MKQHISLVLDVSKHGRIPYNVLDHKLGIIPNKNFQQTNELAEELSTKHSKP